AATGKLIGRPAKMVGTIMRSSPVYADGKIYACSTSAWHVFQPTKEGVKPVGRPMRLAAEDEVSGSPIVSHGRIYLPTGAKLYCRDKPDSKPVATPGPEPPQETPPSKDDSLATVQVEPAEVLLKPGNHQKFTVKLYNARGQIIRNGTASFSLSGPGEI